MYKQYSSHQTAWMNHILWNHACAHWRCSCQGDVETRHVKEGNDGSWIFPLLLCVPHRVVHVPLVGMSPGTPAAAAGSQSWGPRRSEQLWRQTGTPPSCRWSRSSCRPPPWWCCETHLPGCAGFGLFRIIYLHHRNWSRNLGEYLFISYQRTREYRRNTRTAFSASEEATLEIV